MEKLWLKSYPPSVPYDISVSHSSLNDLFDRSVKQFSTCNAYSHLGHKVSYAQLGHYVENFAGYLQNEAKVKKGDRVAIMMPNCFAGVIGLFASLKIGATVVNINPLYTSKELTEVLQNAEVHTIIILDLFTAQLREALKEVRVTRVVTASLADLFPPLKGMLIRLFLRIKEKQQPVSISGAVTFSKAMEHGKQKALSPVVIGTQDIAFLQYSGGTTGKPKAAMLSHGNLLANVSQTLAWFSQTVTEGSEVNVLALPLYHIFSLTVNCLLFLAMGGLNILITNPRDLNGFIKQITKERITFFVGVNTLFNKILQYKKFHTIDFSALKVTVSGGMALQEAVARHWEKETGVAVLEGYGLSEASPIVAVNPVKGHHFNASIGLPLPSTEIKMIDNKGKEVPVGEVGELCVKGPQVMQGYWKNPEATREAISDDGWLSTGDVGYVDEKGFIYLLERKKDIIIVSGFNVYPNEVEEVLMEHPKVDEAAVVGVHDLDSGERVKAFVVLLDESLTETDLELWCQKSLAKYKCPKFYVFCDDLPKTNVGKILRRELR
jgi:long-chain acyl-CoA synthetase